MKIAVVIPWRAAKPERTKALMYVIENVRSTFSDAQLILSDTDHPVFSRAGARNAGVREAIDMNADVVVMLDADSVPEDHALHSAVRRVDLERDSRIHIAYDRFRALSQSSTARYMRGERHSLETVLETDWSVGGAFVFRPETWFNLGGMDERFVGWGMEDVALVVAHTTLLGPMPRHEGVLTHLWHPADVRDGTEAYEENITLYRKYQEAAHNASAMRALIGIA